MAENSEKDESSIVRSIPAIFGKDAITMPTVYANHLFVSHAGPEFFLIFGVVTPPFILPGDEAKFAELKEVEAAPVAKIAVSPESMLAMAKTIQTNVEKYLETKDLREQEVLTKEVLSNE